ncbi:MAG: energy transducer TonB [Bacteroidales bacterium]|nr:energy transducer TonB [Bacteroidales bacterium]
MEKKKADKADLEKRSSIFFEIGLIVAISLVLIAFEWTSTGFKTNEFEVNQAEQAEQEIIPITRQEKPKPKPPEPPKVTEILQIVNNNVKLDDELQLQDLEADINTEVKPINYDVQEEEDQGGGEIFFIVEDMPTFQGKDVNAFRDWVAKRLKYPEIAAENGISGRVYVQFVVEPDGRVDNVKVIRGVDPALDAEAVRVVKSSPRWTPGKQRGKPVRVAYTIPIVFVLQ